MDTSWFAIAIGLATLVILGSEFAVADDGPGILISIARQCLGSFIPWNPEIKQRTQVLVWRSSRKLLKAKEERFG